MSDLQIEICEEIEKILMDKLCLEPCEATYELSLEILNKVLEKMPYIDFPPLYVCDPRKNKECKKTLCQEECFHTKNKEFMK